MGTWVLVAAWFVPGTDVLPAEVVSVASTEELCWAYASQVWGPKAHAYAQRLRERGLSVEYLYTCQRRDWGQWVVQR